MRNGQVYKHCVAAQALPFVWCRHIVYDVLVSLFNMQHLFGVYTPDAQILVLDRHLNDTLR